MSPDPPFLRHSPALLPDVQTKRHEGNDRRHEYDKHRVIGDGNAEQVVDFITGKDFAHQRKGRHAEIRDGPQGA